MVIRFLAAFCLTLFALNALAADITVQVDRDPVALNESFTLTFEAAGSVQANPDFGPLQHEFEILSRSQSSNMQLINGSFSQQTRWTLLLMAKRAGKLNVPSLAFGNDRSPAISITVNEQTGASAASDVGDLFIEVDASPAHLYVQQQLIYTIRFFRAIDINGAAMSEPHISGGDAVVEKLGDDSSFEIRRDGRRYLVVERRYAIFPQQSGTLTLEPISLDVQVPQAVRGLFDPFGQNSSTKRLKSKSITLEVAPIPAAHQGKPWLPANSVSLTQSWSQDPPAFVVGEPITRTLTLKAEGLSSAQLPSLAMADSDAFKAYPDQARLNDKRNSRGIESTRQEKIALIPTRAGEMRLPAIEIPWWNVTTQQMESVTLPAHTFNVAPAPNTSATNTVTAPVELQASAPIEAEAAVPEAESTWRVVSIILALGWAATLFAWGLQRRKKPDSKTPQHNPSPAEHKAALDKVKKACLANDAQAAKTALLAWAGSRWPAPAPASLGEIGARLDAACRDQLDSLNRALYAAGTAAWQGEPLWRALSQAAANAEKPAPKKSEALLPLYP